jgi:hypothetical protein
VEELEKTRAKDQKRADTMDTQKEPKDALQKRRQRKRRAAVQRVLGKLDEEIAQLEGELRGLKGHKNKRSASVLSFDDIPLPDSTCLFP